MVFQDPYGALAPRMSIGTALEEPLRIHHIGDKQRRRQRVAQLLALVGLDQSLANRYPASTEWRTAAAGKYRACAGTST